MQSKSSTLPQALFLSTNLRYLYFVHFQFMTLSVHYISVGINLLYYIYLTAGVTFHVTVYIK